MQFTKNTSKGKLFGTGKILIKIIVVIFVVFLAIVLIDRINLPAPIKNIEKIISNENFKTIK
tara:strand:- start:355 stop:540 length:186 start_codon:yes stop_codon:yes gene_type:complete